MKIHRGAKVSKPDPNHANHPNQFSGQNPNFRNSLRGFDRHKEHHLKGYERTGNLQDSSFLQKYVSQLLVCKMFGQAWNWFACKRFGPSLRCHFHHSARIYECFVVWIISDALTCSLHRYYSWNWRVFNFGLHTVCNWFAYLFTSKPFLRFGVGLHLVKLVCHWFALCLISPCKTLSQTILACSQAQPVRGLFGWSEGQHMAHGLI